MFWKKIQNFLNLLHHFLEPQNDHMLLTMVLLLKYRYVIFILLPTSINQLVENEL
jgi:hypothetical protein